MIAKIIDSPVGKLTLVADNQTLIAVLWEQENPKRVPLKTYQIDTNNTLLNQAAEQLEEYFKGKRTQFDLPIIAKGTSFQLSVWKELSNIPYGKTISYLDIAKKIGNPRAVRAVGNAIGKNPLSILIPCHRVIGTSGHLTGFAGGLERKSSLLKIES